jgi:hypothetical protein
MKKNSKGIKKSTKSAIPAKKKLTNLKSGKAAPKKAVAKKTITKKRIAPKKAVAKKTTIKKKPSNTHNEVQPLKKKANPQKAVARKPAVATSKTQEPLPKEINLPPVEEKSPEVVPFTNNSGPGEITKSMQKATVRHYDNHNIQLSNKKGGIRPSGKKPLW